MSDTKRAEGWGFPGNARKAHYFAGDNTALCGKWLFLGELEPDTGKPSRDDCVACRRQFEARAVAAEAGEVSR